MSNAVREVFNDYTKGSNILDAIIENVNLYKKTNKLEIDLKTDKKINVGEIYYFEEYLKNQFKIETVDIEFNYTVDIENTIEQDWENIEKYLSKNFPLIKTILQGSRVEIDGNTVFVVLKTTNSAFLHSYNIDKVLEDLIQKLYNKKMKVQYKEEVEEDFEEKQKQYLEQLGKDACKTIIANNKTNGEFLQAEAEENQTINKLDIDDPVIIGRNANIKEQVVKIKDLTPDYGKVALEGKVISTDSRELKNGKTLAMFNLYDGTSTITCKSFIDPKKQDLEGILKRIKNSGRLKIQGNAAYDNFAKEIGVIANVVVEIPPAPETTRMDNAKEKRVELHLHTQMSQMDAVSSATDLIKRAAKWGMKSIAITDHGVVQAFPEANHAVEDNKLDIKVIYGVEAYLVPDEEIPEGVEERLQKSKTISCYNFSKKL